MASSLHSINSSSSSSSSIASGSSSDGKSEDMTIQKAALPIFHSLSSDKKRNDVLYFDAIEIRNTKGNYLYKGNLNEKELPEGLGRLLFAYPEAPLNGPSCNQSTLIHYEGNFKGGKAHGDAKISFQNGPSRIFEGVFRNGRMIAERIHDENGSSRLLSRRPIHSSCYIGEVNEKGAPHGKGWFIFQRGDFYAGSFENGKFHGWGERVFANGSFYQGPFIHDVRTTELPLGADLQKISEPTATLRYQDGTIYRGFFRDNLPEGQGMLLLSNEIGSIETLFSKGCIPINQRATLLFNKGKVSSLKYYEGLFKNRRPCGLGTYVFKDGSILQGCFEENALTARKAIRILPNGDRKIGQFKDGRLATAQKVEIQIECSQTFVYYQGMIDAEEEPHGTGKIFDADKNFIYKGQFKNGNLVEDPSPLSFAHLQDFGFSLTFPIYWKDAAEVLIKEWKDQMEPKQLTSLLESTFPGYL